MKTRKIRKRPRKGTLSKKDAYIWSPYQGRSVSYRRTWLRPPSRKWDAPVSDTDDSSATVTEAASCPPNKGRVKLTRERLMTGLNCGAPNRRQLELLGMAWPPSSGWRHRLIGRDIAEETYREFVALRKQKKRATPPVPPDPSLEECTIHFDGGTTCNIPSRGYGNGYGSYLVNEEIVKVDFGRPMSSNQAEIRTLIAAV
jgi:hypothetical protein